MCTNGRQLVWSRLWYLVAIFLVCVPGLSMAQPPVVGLASQTASGGALGDFAAYAWVFAASVLILASALAVLIVAVAREVIRAPASALASRHWYISLVAGSAALFGILIAELFLFFALQPTGATQLASASSVRDGGAETVARAAPATADEAVEETAGVTRPVDAESMVPGDPQEITLGPDEQRRFELTVPGSGEYVIDVRGLSNNFDAYLSVFDENGDLLESDDDGGNGLDSRLTIALEDDRTYYLVVQDNFGQAGRCSLSVQAPTG